jgi:hypothetical protein
MPKAYMAFREPPGWPSQDGRGIWVVYAIAPFRSLRGFQRNWVFRQKGSAAIRHFEIRHSSWFSVVSGVSEQFLSSFQVL